MSNEMISIILGVVGVAAVLLAMGGVYRFISRKLDRLMHEVKRAEARLITKGMMREGNIQAPCVLPVSDGALWVTSLVKSKRFEIPMEDIHLKKEAKWLSRGLRWARYGFHLDTPRTNGLIIAVRDPEPWRDIFR